MHCHKTLILVFSFLLCQVCCLLDASYLSYTLKMGLFSFICSWSLLCAMQGMNCRVIESFVSGRFDDCTKDERERLSNDINSLQVCIAHPSLHRALSTCVFFLCYLISIMGTDKWQTKPWKELSSCIWAPKDLGPHTLLYLRLSIHGRAIDSEPFYQKEPSLCSSDIFLLHPSSKSAYKCYNAWDVFFCAKRVKSQSMGFLGSLIDWTKQCSWTAPPISKRVPSSGMS
jgi:hypothetical protein